MVDLNPTKTDIKIKSGDIILVSNKSSILLKGMKFFQNDPVIFGHALIAKDDTFAYESKHTIRVRNIKDVLDSYELYLIVRKKNFNINKKDILDRLVKDLIGRPYGFLRLFLLMLDNIFNTTKFTRLSKNINNQICSSLVAWIYYVLFDIKFNDKVWYSCDPDDIHDEITKNIGDWSIIKTNYNVNSENS